MRVFAIVSLLTLAACANQNGDGVEDSRRTGDLLAAGAAIAAFLHFAN